MTKVYNLYFDYLDTDLLALHFLKGEFQVKLYVLKAVLFKELFIFSIYPFVTAALREAVDAVFLWCQFWQSTASHLMQKIFNSKTLQKNCIRFREKQVATILVSSVFFYTRTRSFKKVDRNFSFKRLFDNGSYINRKLFLENFEECTYLSKYLSKCARPYNREEIWDTWYLH